MAVDIPVGKYFLVKQFFHPDPSMPKLPLHNAWKIDTELKKRIALCLTDRACIMMIIFDTMHNMKLSEQQKKDRIKRSEQLLVPVLKRVRDLLLEDMNSIDSYLIVELRALLAENLVKDFKKCSSKRFYFKSDDGEEFYLPTFYDQKTMRELLDLDEPTSS